jgi:hypothetical protein
MELMSCNVVNERTISAPRSGRGRAAALRRSVQEPSALTFG